MLRDRTSYRPLSPEEIYSKKLEALVVDLKSVLYGDNAFVTSADYACKACAGRIKLHTQDGKWYCLRCATLPGAVVPQWPHATREHVVEIMSQYPEEVVQILPKIVRREHRTDRDRSRQRIAFGARVEEARESLGWTQEQLASKILKKDGNAIKPSTVNGIEKGHDGCSLSIREQLETVLGLERITV